MISKELQEIMAAIERLNPECQVGVCTPTSGSIRFTKETKDGTYEGSMSFEDAGGGGGWNEEHWSGSSSIGVTLSSEANKTTIFSKNYSGGTYETSAIRDYVTNNKAYREEISRQESARAQAREAEQAEREVEKKARERFLGRKTKKA